MPFSGFDDWDDCVRTMTEEEGHDQDSAESICGALQSEAKADNGDPGALMDALEAGRGLISDVSVDLNSAVDVPAIDSKWVMMKSDERGDGYNRRVESPILMKQDRDGSEKRISYAPAMIPREPDKEGDVVPTPVVERAAHGYLENDGGVDTDHNLVDGKGTVVESWIEPEQRSWDLPGGGSETYPAGTWMVGIKWGKETWDRIKDGELTGLSIYGMAEHTPLARSADGIVGTAKQLDIPLANESVVHLVYESRTAAEKASEEIGLGGAVHEHEFDGMDVFMPGESHEAFVDRYMELSDEASEGDESDAVEASALSATKPEDGDTTKGADSKSDPMGSETDDPTLSEVAASVSDMADELATIKEAVESDKAPGDSLSDLISEFADRAAAVDDVDKDTSELESALKEALNASEATDKQDPQDAAAVLAEQFDMSTGDVLDVLDAGKNADPGEVVEAINGIAAEVDESSKEEHGDMDGDDEDEDEMDKSAKDPGHEDANFSKGYDGENTREQQAKDRSGDGGTGTGLPSYKEAAEAEYGD